jgi:hypothetical protein
MTKKTSVESHLISLLPSVIFPSLTTRPTHPVCCACATKPGLDNNLLSRAPKEGPHTYLHPSSWVVVALETQTRGATKVLQGMHQEPPFFFGFPLKLCLLTGSIYDHSFNPYVPIYWRRSFRGRVSYYPFVLFEAKPFRSGSCAVTPR